MYVYHHSSLQSLNHLQNSQMHFRKRLAYSIILMFAGLIMVISGLYLIVSNVHILPFWHTYEDDLGQRCVKYGNDLFQKQDSLEWCREMGISCRGSVLEGRKYLRARVDRTKGTQTCWCLRKKDTAYLSTTYLGNDDWSTAQVIEPFVCFDHDRPPELIASEKDHKQEIEVRRMIAMFLMMGIFGLFGSLVIAYNISW